MNCWDVDRAERQYAQHPILGPATQTLHNLMEWTDRNSDGWAYWPKPARAAARLMTLIERDGTSRYMFDSEREDVTEAEYRAALRPIKSFRTRQNADFEIVEELREIEDNQEEIDRRIAEHELAIFNDPDPRYGP
jgi:hypothetical protein